MASTLDGLPELARERVRPLRRVEYERLAAQGSFDDERVELLGGVIVEMSPQDPRHAVSIERLTALLGPLARGRAILRPQLPLAISDDSLPAPDLALVPLGDYSEAHPRQALLVVEVANTSPRKDRVLKSELYARAGVPEYWVVDVGERRIEIGSGPRGGVYLDRVTVRPGDVLPIPCLGDAVIAVDDILR